MSAVEDDTPPRTLTAATAIPRARRKRWPIHSPSSPSRPQSRHPKSNRGYDHKTHTYRAGYVKPSAWRLTLSACAQLPTEVLVEPPSPTEEEDGGDHKPDLTEVPVIPPDVEKYEWTVEQVPSGFKKVFGAQPPLCDATVDVPAPGTYRITLTIRKRGGSFLRSDPTLYRLRDALVVSLGESAASGQGNPDVPGEPTLLGSGQCELTTLSAIIDGFGIGVSMEREPTWQEPLAYRSYLSGPSRAALALEDWRAGKLVTFLSFASSGAEIEKGLFQPQRDFQDVGQIEEARRTVAGRRIDALLLSIGGNDVNFGPGLKDLVKDFVGKGQDATFEEINHEIDLLPRKYRLLAERIEDRLNPRQSLHHRIPDRHVRPVRRHAGRRLRDLRLSHRTRHLRRGRPSHPRGGPPTQRSRSGRRRQARLGLRRRHRGRIRRPRLLLGRKLLRPRRRLMPPAGRLRGHDAPHRRRPRRLQPPPPSGTRPPPLPQGPTRSPRPGSQATTS